MLKLIITTDQVGGSVCVINHLNIVQPFLFNRCDHLTIFDYNYKASTVKYVAGSGAGSTPVYNAISKEVEVSLCKWDTRNDTVKRFFLEFEVLGIYILLNPI